MYLIMRMVNEIFIYEDTIKRDKSDTEKELNKLRKENPSETYEAFLVL